MLGQLVGLKEMEGSSLPTSEAKIQGVRFGLATRQEICKASISDCPISHASQLSNPFLGLPLETGKCESCGTGEPGRCEGHFGYIELPTPIYHPDHVGELRKMLSLLCLKCLKLRKRKFPVKNIGVAERVLSACCEETSQISIYEAKTTDGACYLELKIPSRSKFQEGFWNFLEKYGFRYGDMYSRPLLPFEVMAILRKIPQETRKKLSAKGYFPQDGYILQHLPVPPNCLSVPDISDGINTMSTDYSITLLKKVLRQVEIIKNSRSGMPNFESHEIESNDLQATVAQYLQFRGTGKASRDVDTRFGVNKEINASSTKAWLEKMKTLFIRKGSGFSSRSVITGDPFTGVSEIGLPFEIAQKITFEERVNEHNREFLQRLVDEKLCLAYRDGMSTYSLREGSKGHTFLRSGQVVHRRIMDGDIVFINRPPTTHKHSLQALSVYVHGDHTVKINPLICGPLSADFDGDCIHLFYPQSLEAKAEALELFSVDKQLLSSHTGNFNLQLATDSLLSLKILFRKHLLNRATVEQLAMFVPSALSTPAVIKSKSGPLWSASQILQMCLPSSFDCSGEKYFISKSEVLSLDFSRDVMASIVNDVVTSLFFLKGPKEVLRFFNSIQPLLMESLYANGFSVSLRDLFLPRDVLESTLENIQRICTNFIFQSSAIGYLIDSKSESALSKVVQQIAFLGMQITQKGKYYSEALVKDMSSMFKKRYPSCDNYRIEDFGLVGKPLFRGLDPYHEMVHSISSREVIVRSTRGLSEPGTLFKNLMAILRDVLICQDGTVRNMCSNSIIQFEYGVHSANIANEFCAGDPVGVLAATAMSNPAYKAVLDSSPSSNNSWEMMKEILLCGVSFKNDISDRRVILFLNNCNCGRMHCQESAALMVENQLKKVSLKDTAIEFLIEYRSQMVHESIDMNPGLVGHIHLKKTQLIQLNISMHGILEKCQEMINLHQKKKKTGILFKRIVLSFSDRCSFCPTSRSKWTDAPCIQFLWQVANDDLLERVPHLLADTVCPVLLQTIIKGDPRVATANVVWISPNTETWIRSPCKSPNGELALDIILEKEAVSKSGDAWRIVMDSCLPVIHLIDTQRSIPYAIKQIQELLGISCAFEQAVQRLSTSVTMVTKGVLKDHLLLLGNSMTCAGNLIGFNAGGIKSLSRSLNVQVPFMSATLSTPRKCFERAAEKCYVDNLSSIVASCAWGKHVSVGTGTPFEILWDTRKAELSPQKEIDVYNFLHLVNSGSVLEGVGTSCLGAEIGDLDQEDEFMESDLSPEREPGLGKPTFEDGIEFGLNGDDNNGFSKEDAKESQDGWPSWGNRVDSQLTDWTKKAEQNSWGKKVDSEYNNWAKKADQSSWGEKVNSEESNWTKKPEGSTWNEKINSEESDWSKKAERNTWGKRVDSEDNNLARKADPWNEKFNSQESDWTKKAERNTWSKSVDSEENDWVKKADQSTWGEKVNSEESNWTKKPEGSTWNEKINSEESGWTKKAEENVWMKKVGSEESDWMKKPGQSTWGEKINSRGNTWANKINSDESSWMEKAYSGESDWTKKSEQSTWANKASSEENVWMEKANSGESNWTKNATPSAWAGKDSFEENIWGKKPEESAWVKKADTKDNDWTKISEQSTWAREDRNSSAWGKKVDPDGGGWRKNDEQNTWASSSLRETPFNTWGSSTDWGKFDSESSTGQKKDSPFNNWSSSSQKHSDDSMVTQNWGSPKLDTSSEKDARPQWGRGRGRGRGWGRGGRSREGLQGRGSSNDGERKNKRIRSVENPNSPGLLSATNKRLDSFTVDEQDVLSEIESIMKNIRRVMNQTGYSDGDPLSMDDQNYIVDNVLNYHPDKSAKMGAGLKHIMVSRHEQFQDSRCFYAVSIDDCKADFSYRKCLENLIREKYPDKAETFISKYFRRSQSRHGWSRDRGPVRGEAGTPSWNRDSTPAADEAGTPGWNKDQTPGPADFGNLAADEAETPA